MSKEHLIVRVDIGDFTLDTRYSVSNRNPGDDFSLSSEQTRVMLDRFEANEPINLIYHLANGQRLSSTLYPHGNNNFFAWRRVFETCAQVNKS